MIKMDVDAKKAVRSYELMWVSWLVSVIACSITMIMYNVIISGLVVIGVITLFMFLMILLLKTIEYILEEDDINWRDVDET